MHAYVENNAVVRVGSVPRSWTLKDGRSVSGFNLWTAADIKAEGWLPVVEQFATLGPDQHHGNPVYTVRTDDVLATYPAENDATEAKNYRTVRALALQAAADNRAFIASNPTAGQTAVQVKNLSRQQNNLIRLLLGALEATD